MKAGKPRGRLGAEGGRARRPDLGGSAGRGGRERGGAAETGRGDSAGGEAPGRSRSGPGRDRARPARPDEGAEALLRLQRGLTGDRLLAGAPYMDEPDTLKAYADYYLEVSKAQALRVARAAGLAPRSVLDLGAGPGSVSLAFAELGAERFALVDSSGAALRLAEAKLAEAGKAAGRRLAVSLVEADLESRWATEGGGFDLAAFGHCLNELGTGTEGLSRRLAVVRAAAGHLAPGGAVIAIEPATLESSRAALGLRDALEAAGWRIAAPCARVGPCPALAAGPNHTCHDEASWEPPAKVRRLASAAGLDRELLKMAWFVAYPPSGAGAPVPSAVEAPFAVEATSASTRAGRILPAASAGLGGGPGGVYRVVSAPMLNKAGRVRYLICGEAGRVAFSAKKDDPRAAAAGFFSLARYDLIEVDEPERREGGWGFGPATRLLRLGWPG